MDCAHQLHDRLQIVMIWVFFINEYMIIEAAGRPVDFFVYKMRLDFTVYGYLLTCVLWVCRTMLGCFRRSQECPSDPKKKPHPFLCAARVFRLSACHCALVPQTKGLLFDSLPNERLQQQPPVSHFVISGNRGTSLKLFGCPFISFFLAGSGGWFVSGETDRLYIKSGFKIDERCQTHSRCALCSQYSH